MKLLLEALEITVSNITGEKVPTMDCSMSIDPYKELFNNTREETDSSPSWVHYGHYKAVCEGNLLAEVNLSFMTIPFEAGYPLAR